MKNLSIAITPDMKKLKLKVFMNVKDLKDNLGVEDHLLFKKELSIPVNAWNLILELEED